MRGPLLAYQENGGTNTVTLRRPSLRYLDEFVKLKCASDLLVWGVFPNAKEITESMAAYEAVRRFVGEKRLKDPGVVCVVVGDGVTPRTGAIIATRTKWSVYSVDPKLRKRWQNNEITRLTCISRRIEEVYGAPQILPNADVVVAVHSHAPLLPNAPLVVSMPCCTPEPTLLGLPSFSWEDWGVWSPCRTINVYKRAA